ncbi:hypothetical protein J5N97_021207 [Dioscorea zingiberensis]|uniref:Coiled-coil domain-containing protein 47 n=1 Tax=Dioscorea zingiberensis TaxID=325984 RepID=A0A9D5HEF5_9LILI|nr:hypothetical protein J5N97_021207 [Dioscorea zingiberensis]
MARASPLLLLLLLVGVVAGAIASFPHFEGFDSDELLDDDLSESEPSIPLSSPISSPSISVSVSSSDQPESPDPLPPPASPLATDLWDEDEFEGIPISNPEQHHDRDPDPVLTPPPSEEPAASKPSPRTLRSYTTEIVCVSFLIAFAINYFTGKRENENIALTWASHFATQNSIFDKNFSLLGAGDGKDSPLLLKEGQDVFKFWASGRRYCKGLLATMELRSRHDLISRIWDMVFVKKDVITFEVMMDDDAMDHVVMAVARKKAAKAMHKELRDLQQFASIMVSPPAGRKWVAEELAVVTESKEVVADLITEVVLDQVLGEKAFEKFGKGFISLHFSDHYPGSQKKMLIFKFALPDAKNMADMTRLVTLVPYYIDVIGRYKLSSQARAKTDAARAKAAQEAYKELQNARQEALQKKKAEKKKLVEDAETKLNAESIRRKEEKERARQLKKSMPRVKMMRSH